MEDLKVQRVKNHKKTNHHNFECCRYFIKENEELFFLEFDADEQFSNFIMSVCGEDTPVCVLYFVVPREQRKVFSHHPSSFPKEEEKNKGSLIAETG